ncbi:2-keto-3-deoxy-galactonokinase [Serratia fonticola]|uniref:2-keto-3-deoxy-galactonokinase n=1 Tax=Serratia fonticola TaxID=47917 RepID=A0A4U9TW46_SERFO|nr:2-keto-3-deoxy-galactonokinase [Serratia fonticola]
MFIVIDSGSSTTRIYLLAFADSKIIDKITIDEGVNSTVTHGNNNLLRQEMVRGVTELLARNGKAQQDITFIIASGMITSNLGFA